MLATLAHSCQLHTTYFNSGFLGGQDFGRAVELFYVFLQSRVVAESISTMIQNKKETVKSIADHMQVPYTDQLLEEIVDATEFDTMKKAKRSTEEKLRQRFGDDASLYRKGKVHVSNLSQVIKAHDTALGFDC